MKKLLIRLLCLLFCLTMCLGVFVGCADDDVDKENPVVTIDGKGEDRFAKADFSGTTLKICMSNYKGGDRVDISAKYMTGTEEATSDNIMISVNERNEYIENKLKLDVKYSYIDDNWDTGYQTLYNLYSSNEDVPDAVSNQSYILIQCMLADVLINCNTSEYTNYFDFTDGTWYDDAMSSYALGNDVTKKETGVYLLANDYFIDYIAGVWAMFVNENILASATDWLPEDLYSRIKDGEWTWDTMLSIAAVAFEDHQDVEANRNGFLFAAGATSTGVAPSPRYQKQLTYTADIELLVYENGKYSYSNTAVNSEFSRLVEKMIDMHGRKYVTSKKATDDSVDILRTYSKNNTLFAIFHLYDLESDLVAGLKASPVVIPKLDADDRYKSVTDERSAIGAIFNSTDKFDAMSAYWQYQAIKSDKTRETYYIDGLGLKYETGENTKDMLDLIYTSVISEPNYIWDRYMGQTFDRHDMRFDNILMQSIWTGTSTVSSSWAEVGAQKAIYLNETIEKYNKLHR